MLVRRNDVNAIWLHLYLPLHLNHRHRSSRLNDGGKITFVLRRQVHHHHEGQPAVGRHLFEKLPQYRYPASRCPQAHDSCWRPLSTRPSLCGNRLFFRRIGFSRHLPSSSTCDLVLHHAANRRGTQLPFPTTVEFQRFSISAFSRAGPLHLEGHLRVNAVRGKFFPIHGGAEFLHVNGANVAQCLGGFLDYILRCFLPASRRFRKYLNYFYDLWHELDSLPLPFRAASGIWPQDWREEASGSSHWAIGARATSRAARDLVHARLITPAKFG